MRNLFVKEIVAKLLKTSTKQEVFCPYCCAFLETFCGVGNICNRLRLDNFWVATYIIQCTNKMILKRDFFNVVWPPLIGFSEKFSGFLIIVFWDFCWILENIFRRTNDNAMTFKKIKNDFPPIAIVQKVGTSYNSLTSARAPLDSILPLLPFVAEKTNCRKGEEKGLQFPSCSHISIKHQSLQMHLPVRNLLGSTKNTL